MSDAASAPLTKDEVTKRLWQIQHAGPFAETVDAAIALIERQHATIVALTARAVAAEQHKMLDRLGKSSYQEVVEDKLRTELAEAQVRLDSQALALTKAQQEIERLQVAFGQEQIQRRKEVAALTAERDALEQQLLEIARLRLATNEGTLRARADRMWEIAEAGYREAKALKEIDTP